MKQHYNLITIKLKIAKTQSINNLFDYKTLISSFRHLQDLGILEVEYFDNKEVKIEKVDDWFEFCDHNEGKKC